MPATIRDVQDAILNGRAKIEGWKKEHKRNFYQPDRDLEIAKFWQSLPKVVREYYKVNKPEIYKDMTAKFGGE